VIIVVFSPIWESGLGERVALEDEDSCQALNSALVSSASSARAQGSATPNSRRKENSVEFKICGSLMKFMA